MFKRNGYVMNFHDAFKEGRLVRVFSALRANDLMRKRIEGMYQLPGDICDNQEQEWRREKYAELAAEIDPEAAHFMEACDLTLCVSPHKRSRKE